MYNVQFPKLGIELTINRVAFSPFGFDVYWYGLLIGIGVMLMLLAVFYRTPKLGINTDHFIDAILGTTVGAVIGARAYYVAFAPFEYESFLDMINIRDGGLAIYGGVIGGLLVGMIACRIRRINILDYCDIILGGTLIGQAVGRWGNFMNQEAFGTNTDGLFGMISEGTTAYLTRVQPTLAAQGITVDPSMPVHPTFLYESVWCLMGFILLQLYFNRRKFKGEIACLYLVWYGIGRFFIEGLRTDSLEIVAGLRTSQLVAILSIVAGVAIIIYNRFDFKGKAKTDAQIKQMYDNRDRERKIGR
ncbi:MAG: prolipoprotein diacylglyceryl transferase [Oscillospiraceae bacterium]|nr:prolipoprotein diacylglyceryl transferase [Oscillospiraceae bacterium]MBR2503386.1 prolipoprotein diacylglyceryl transferase [Oscillospiraceae bacterium]